MKPRQRAFLAAYAECGNITQAAKISKTARAGHYTSMQDNPEYAAAFVVAEEEAVQYLEIECRRRATVGTSRPLFSKGQLVFEPARDATTGEIIRDPETGRVLYSDTIMMISSEPSDNLLMFLLKSKRPNVYRDNASLELSGSGGGPISVSVEFVKAG